MTADKPDPLDRIVREACEKRTNARIARLGIVAPWKHGDDCECPTIRAALEQAREECIEAEVQQRVKHATTVAQGEALDRAAAEAERDEARDKAIKHEPDCASKPAGCGHDARLPLLCDCGASGN